MNDTIQLWTLIFFVVDAIYLLLGTGIVFAFNWGISSSFNDSELLSSILTSIILSAIIFLPQWIQFISISLYAGYILEVNQ